MEEELSHRRAAAAPRPSVHRSHGAVPHLEQPSVTAAAIVAFLRGETIAGDDDASALVVVPSPLERLNRFLDTPILDTNERGGPLEPFKRFARVEPEAARLVASVVAVVGVGAFWRLLFSSCFLSVLLACWPRVRSEPCR